MEGETFQWSIVWEKKSSDQISFSSQSRTFSLLNIGKKKRKHSFFSYHIIESESFPFPV